MHQNGNSVAVETYGLCRGMLSDSIERLQIVFPPSNGTNSTSEPVSEIQGVEHDWIYFK